MALNRALFHEGRPIFPPSTRSAFLKKGIHSFSYFFKEDLKKEEEEEEVSHATVDYVRALMKIYVIFRCIHVPCFIPFFGDDVGSKW